MKLRTRAALLKLVEHAPPAKHEQVQRMRAEIIGLFGSARTARTLVATMVPGHELIAAVRGDRADAVEYAADSEHARRLAQWFRNYAKLLDDGAARIGTALTVRDDRLEIIAAAKNGMSTGERPQKGIRNG